MWTPTNEPVSYLVSEDETNPALLTGCRWWANVQNTHIKARTHSCMLLTLNRCDLLLLMSVLQYRHRHLSPCVYVQISILFLFFTNERNAAISQQRDGSVCHVHADGLLIPLNILPGFVWPRERVWPAERVADWWTFLKRYHLNMTVFNFPELYFSWVSVPVNYLRSGVSRFVHGGEYLSEMLFFDVMHVM